MVETALPFMVEEVARSSPVNSATLSRVDQVNCSKRVEWATTTGQMS